MRVNQEIRYQPDERTPFLMSIGVGVQGVLLALGPVVVLVGIAFRESGQPDGSLSWAVFASMAVSGIVTIVQAVRFGRLGSGHLYLTGTAPLFVVVCIPALATGGPPLLASLVVVSSFIQFAVAAWLPLLRRVFTPVVTGTVMMLVAATVAPIGMAMLDNLPAGVSGVAAPVVCAVTLMVAVGMALRASGAWRLWSPLIGIVAGSAAAVPFGAYDIHQVISAPWLAFPVGHWPGLDLTFGTEFWALLPLFVAVTLVVTTNTISDMTVIQSASLRRPRATDFRRIQGALNVNGLGLALAGIAGAMPIMGYAGASTSLISLTGVAARNVCYAAGAILFCFAFLPKLSAILLAVPGPVLGVYFIVVSAVIFMGGVRAVFQGGGDFRTTLIAGLAFWIGEGVEHQSVFPDLAHGHWGVLFGDGIVVGSAAAILMTMFLELTSARRRRLDVELDMAALPEIDTFLRELASRSGWNEPSTQRLRAAGEETLSSLSQPGDGRAAANPPRLRILGQSDGRTIELEFMAVFEHGNIEDRLAYLGDQVEAEGESEISFRLLRHYASSVRHRRYQGIDVVTVQVENSP